MARRAALIKKKPKKARATRSETYLVNFKYLGDEPSPADINKNLVRALNWYGSMCSKEEARDYMKEYLTNTNRKDQLKKLARVNDTWLPTTACWLARILTRAPNTPDAGILAKKLDSYLADAFRHLEEEKVETPANDRPSIQDRIKDRINDIIGDIEELIDAGEPFSLYDYLQKNQIPAMHANKIIAYYSPWFKELVEAITTDDSQLKEGYAHLSRKALKERMEFFGQMLQDAEKYGNVAKKTRAPRKPRAVSVEKKLKNFKYQKESAEFKIASINPEKIIGAQELWAFNTKYKTITVLRALDRGGLQIKGTSITGFDEKSSQTKGTGRKPETVVDKLQNGGKIVLRKLMEELKTDKPLQYRINENTILMKVQ